MLQAVLLRDKLCDTAHQGNELVGFLPVRDCDQDSTAEIGDDQITLLAAGNELVQMVVSHPLADAGRVDIDTQGPYADCFGVKFFGKIAGNENTVMPDNDRTHYSRLHANVLEQFVDLVGCLKSENPNFSITEIFFCQTADLDEILLIQQELADCGDLAGGRLGT